MLGPRSALYTDPSFNSDLLYICTKPGVPPNFELWGGSSHQVSALACNVGGGGLPRLFTAPLSQSPMCQATVGLVQLSLPYLENDR